MTEEKTPRYAMHKYWGKKPSNDLKLLIESYSEPSEILLDPFSGYGVFACEAYLNARNVISIDLNPAATFIQSQLMDSNADIYRLKIQAEQIKRTVAKYYEYWYSETCVQCGGLAKVIATLRNKEDVPLKHRLQCNCSKKAIEQDVTDDAKERLITMEVNAGRPDDLPSSPLIRNGRISVFDGMTTDHLFTKRALQCHKKLHDEIVKTEDKIVRDSLLFAFTSNIANCSRLVPPIKSRGDMNPGAWMTGFYTGQTYIENNVFHYFSNRLEKVLSGKRNFLEQKKLISRTDRGRVQSITNLDCDSVGYVIENGDAKKLNLPDNSIDYVFTDFPYGDSVPYFEQSAIWNTWLGNSVDYDNEIVVSDSPVRRKTQTAFKADIATCVLEIWRVLKPERFFSTTFHSLSGEEWHALLSALLVSGFSLFKIEWMEQKTFAPRQLNRKITIKGDMLITMQKPKNIKTVVFLDEAKTTNFVRLHVTQILNEAPKDTNAIYMSLLTTFFTEHIVPESADLVQILFDNFSFCKDGLWSIRN